MVHRILMVWLRKIKLYPKVYCAVGVHKIGRLVLCLCTVIFACACNGRGVGAVALHMY